MLRTDILICDCDNVQNICFYVSLYTMKNIIMYYILFCVMLPVVYIHRKPHSICLKTLFGQIYANLHREGFWVQDYFNISSDDCKANANCKFNLNRISETAFIVG